MATCPELRNRMCWWLSTTIRLASSALAGELAVSGHSTAGQSWPTAVFYVLAHLAPIFFSRSSLGSSIVFCQNPQSCSFPFICSFVFGSFALSASCLAAVDFGSTVLPV